MIVDSLSAAFVDTVRQVRLFEGDGEYRRGFFWGLELFEERLW